MRSLSSRPLEVVFLVEFTDFAFRSIPAVAQLVDAIPSRLTLLHATHSEDLRPAEEQLASFFPEADRYPHCERLVERGRIEAVVARRCASAPVDLVLAPAARPLAGLRPGQRSGRLELLRRTGVPLWTIGPSTDLGRLGASHRNVACWLDVGARSHPQLGLALEYARHVDAQLHLLTALPEISLAVSLRPDIPLHPTAATEALLRVAGPSVRAHQVHVAERSSARERRRLLQAANADLLFVPFERGPWLEWFGARPALLEAATCPVVLVPEHARAQWNLLPRCVPVPAARTDARRRAS